MESWLTPLGTETSHENDKSKALSPGQVFELEAVYRRRTRAVSPDVSDGHLADQVSDVIRQKRVVSVWRKQVGSLRSFCNLEESEKDLVKEIQTKYHHQDVTKREPLLHIAVRTGNLAIVEFYLEAACEKVRVKNFKGQTALHVAAELDLPDIAVLLLRCQTDRQQACWIARNFSIDVDCLSDLDADSDSDCSASQTAVTRMNSSDPDTLIGSSATVTDDHFLLMCRDLNFFTAFSSAALKGSKNVLRILFEHAQTTLVHAHVWKDVLQIADISQSSLLHLAVISRCFGTVKMCLEEGIDINLKRNGDGNTAMHSACEIGYLNVVKLLVRHDASVVEVLNHKKQTPLHRAAVFNRDDVVQYLLSMGADIEVRDIFGNTPLLCASSHGSTAAVEVLASHGADLTASNHRGCTVVHNAIGHVDTMQAVLQLNSLDANFLNTKDSVDENTALHYASAGGYYQNVVQLLESGAHPNPRNSCKRIPLHMAAEKGWLSCVKRLIGRSRTRRSINATDHKGKTPLHRATAYGHSRVVDFLIHKGATVLRDSKGMTPLHYAAVSGDEMSCKLTLCADPHCLNDRDKDGNTALHLAAKTNYPDVIQLLLDREAEFSMNKVDRNPLDEAIHCGNFAAAEVFADHSRWEDALRAKVKRVVVDTKSRFMGNADEDSKVFKLKKEEKTQLQLMVEKMPKVALKFLDRCHVTDESCSKETFDYRLLLGYADKDDEPHSGFDGLRTMCECKAKTVLAHPVCCAFLNNKWLHYGSYYFLVAGLVVVTYVTLLSIYIFEAHPLHWTYRNINVSANGTKESLKSPGGIRTLQYLLTIAALLHGSVNLFRVRHMGFRALMRLTWLMSMIMSCCTLIFMIPFKDAGEQHKWVFGSISVFSGWMTLVLWLRRVPYWGIFIVMVYKMFKRLTQVLILIVMFTLAFAFAFYAMLAPAAHDLFIAFKKIPRASLKVFTMILGEIDFSDLFTPNETNPNDDSVVPHLGWLAVLYIIFVLIMPVIVMNLLIGLAVGDIEKLEENMPRFFLKRYWVEKETRELTSSRWRSKLWNLLSVSVDPDTEREMELNDERLAKFLCAIERLEARSVTQDRRIQHVQMKIDKLVEKLLPSLEMPPCPSPRRPMTFKDAALTVASRIRSPRTLTREVTSGGAVSAVGKQKGQEQEIHGADLVVHFTSSTDDLVRETDV